ncbi:hypothetical protein TIFTF001_017025 [Ficus carica]|uniref:Uncharacterized protein n=1 Tax=Ficus carica TaxID=3494 RepID=A0AA88A8U0_FICCA|nr:hypothetical protein TIFTF001_017025 [Ficus carica]
MKSLQTKLTALRMQAQSGFSTPNIVPWQYATIPKAEQPLPVVPQKENHVLRLKRLIEQDSALRKLKGKQKEQGSISQMMIRFHQPSIPSEEESAPEDSDLSSKVSELEESTSPQPIMMNQPTVTEIPDQEEQTGENQPPRQQRSTTQAATNGKPQTFTLDDIPPSKWRDRFQEFKAFLVLQIQKPNSQSGAILLNFVSRFVEILQDWWMSLGEYRQLIFLQTESVEGALAQLYSEFCVEENQIVEQARLE